MLGAKRNDKFFVCFLLTGFVEHAHVGLTSVEGFAGFAQTAGEAVVDEGGFENSF